MPEILEDKYSNLRAPGVKKRPAFYRRRPLVIGGVCRGLSVHLGGRVGLWRAGFLMLIPTGLPILLYFLFLIFVPSYRFESEVAAQNQRLAKQLNISPQTETQKSSRSRLLLIAALIGAGAFFLTMIGIPQEHAGFKYVSAILILLIGAMISWSTPLVQNNDKESNDFSATRKATIIIGGGIALIGAILLVVEISPRNPILLALTSASVSVLVLLLMFYPIFLRLQSSLRETSIQKARESVRADIAAHLHDSVLQSLVLIRARADDPDAVRMIARIQEKDLRKYLYTERVAEDTSSAQVLRDVVEEVENAYQKEINCVITGDCVPHKQIHAVIAAAREALINACKYGENSEISLYAEISGKIFNKEMNLESNSASKNKVEKRADSAMKVWIRDRGPGFDPSAIPADHAGIRESIIGRMNRIGGKAIVRSPLPSGGTEIHLVYPE